ncbi:MAG: hypothetical protein KME19_13345 [Microcoleus vaginatus WJT46-NPBG5]|nr:hypothetical protein [Microcoleus vaginatus WJT46-NPBG5]
MLSSESIPGCFFPSPAATQNLQIPALPARTQSSLDKADKRAGTGSLNLCVTDGTTKTRTVPLYIERLNKETRHTTAIPPATVPQQEAAELPQRQIFNGCIDLKPHHGCVWGNPFVNRRE